MAQQEMMERIQQEEAENTTTPVNAQKVVEKTDSPSKRKIIKAEPIESIEWINKSWDYDWILFYVLKLNENLVDTRF